MRLPSSESADRGSGLSEVADAVGDRPAQDVRAARACDDIRRQAGSAKQREEIVAADGRSSSTIGRAAPPGITHLVNSSPSSRHSAAACVMLPNDRREYTNSPCVA